MNTTRAAWTDLGRGVRVRQSRVYWMNSVMLLDPEHTVIVDAGVLPSELDDLQRECVRIAPARVTLIFTHGDWDHVLGRPWWPDASTLAHDRFAAEVSRKRDSILASTEAAVAATGERWTRGFEAFRPSDEVSGLHFDRRGPWRLVTRDAFGHSPSMLSVHLPEHGLLIAADMLSDIEIPLLHQPCDVYRKTLAELVPLAEHGAIERLVPGHGAIAESSEAVLDRIHADLVYLGELEHRVGDSHAAGGSIDDAAEAAAAMDYTGKDAEYSMAQNHRKNARLVYQELTAASGPRSRSH